MLWWQVAVAVAGYGCRLWLQVAYGVEEEVELAVHLKGGDRAHEHGAQLVLVHVVADGVLGAGATNVGAEHNIVGQLFVHVGLVEFAVEPFDVGLLLLQGLGAVISSQIFLM